VHQVDGAPCPRDDGDLLDNRERPLRRLQLDALDGARSARHCVDDEGAQSLPLRQVGHGSSAAQIARMCS
jgi:hypothetical protein